MPCDLLDRVLAALEGYTRQRVIDALRRRPRSVAEIHRVLNSPKPFHRAPALSRPAISQALAVLWRARLVQRRVQGRRHIYQLDRTGLDALRDYLEGLEGLARFDA
jgi:DNA-binding transcriptional ArsR family regulator